MTPRIRHVTARQGYDLWADTYDRTPNPVVAMDQLVVPARVAAAPRERILDAACGTGRHFDALLATGARVVGVDFAAGMLRVAARRSAAIPLVQADLEHPLPFVPRSFDHVLCSLVGEHLADLASTFANLRAVLHDGGSLLFSVYHPLMAAAGIEANFERDGTEIRLGAYTHTTDDYRAAMTAAGFRSITVEEFTGTEALVARVPSARKYVGAPILLLLAGETPCAGDAGRRTTC